MIGKRIKYAQRYQEILSALLKHGFGFIIKDLGLVDFISNFHRRKADADFSFYSRSIGERIRLVLEELGPTFVKLGQLASTRIDLIPHGIIKELEKLQDHVAPISGEEAYQIIEKELGKPVDKLFKKFQEEPIASASIGQVHLAQLFTDQMVAVKIQRPHIEEKMVTDLNILADFGHLMESKMDWAKTYQISNIIEEVSRSLRLELDYLTEARNGEKIAKQFQNNDRIVIPSIYWEYTTGKILTMDYMDGLTLREFIDEATINQKKRVAKQFIDCMFQQIFIEGFFHGDPHPGNLIILPDERLGLIDFGMVGRLSPSFKQDLALMIIAMKTKDIETIAEIILKWGRTPELIVSERFYIDLEDMIGLYLDKPLQQINLAEFISNMLQISFTYHISMPPDLTLLAKTLMTMEGILADLDGELAIIDMAQPFGERLLRDRLKPAYIWKKSRKRLLSFQNFLSKIAQLGNMIADHGKIRIDIDIPEIKELNKKLDRITNQLSFAIILLAFSIMMVGLVIGAALTKVDTYLWNFPVIELGGIAATLMFLWLLASVFKSGRF